MSKYVIVFHYAAGYTAFIGNGSYIHQGEKYAVLVENYQEAKRYKTRGPARAAVNRLVESCSNASQDFTIEEVDQDDLQCF